MQRLRLLNDEILSTYGIGKDLPSVVIIGNAGVSAVDESFIAEADCVVRFNNYATRQGITHTSQKDRCDILFSTLDLHSSCAKPNDLVIGIPFPFKAKEIATKPNRWYAQSNHWMVNPYLNMQMCEELKIDSLGCAHPLPSVGFTALWHMHKWQASFYVCGFEWYYNKDTNLFQGWDLRNKQYPTHWNHNYPKEVEWIINNLLNKNNFIFSSQCLKILNKAKQLLK